MQSIKFKGGFVQTLNPEVRRLAAQVGHMQHGVARVKGGLDGRISSRRGISANLAKAGSSVGRIERRLNELSSFVNQSVNSYTLAENSVNKRAVSLISSWNKGFGLSAGNNPGVKAIEKAVTKAEKKKSTFDEILSYFGSLNEKMGLMDAALIGSQLTSMATAFAVGKKLRIHYFGGKPSLWQKLKGGYKFSVGADASWTSKGKYSSKTAKFLYDFAKSTPSNPVTKQLHKIVSSYNNPSAILKHVAGFPKNANFMRAEYLMKSVHERIDMGTKGMLKSVAEAKGFAKVGRGIPVVSTGITLIASVAEFNDSYNSGNKGVFESAGRAVSGLALDMAAIGAGAKAGAVIGSLGGPVGTVIGGAVGGFVGGVVSVKWGDQIKDVGGSFAKKLDVSVGPKISEWKKSITSWFN
ncbi:hypothetical protein [Mesobacillus jeotgali]|uniref:LXG domain-containing protein n=1 Tax=Mesobacillus jeotgali TaxID=129985 RepID=A0ABY9VJC6_9BACI|nr:hypothetical protein [Mesobacillus jeotgali]WNF22705.1 hypothetical protein RH061_21540 [Mesobacillus jeotgali]